MSKSIPRLFKDGKVGVLISPGFGAGWSTWSSEYREELLFHEKLVQAKLDKVEDVEPILNEILPKDHCTYVGGWHDCVVIWMDQGTRFYVEEYDGSESVKYVEDLCFTA